MAGSTTANKNRCVQMTKKSTATGGAATKGGAKRVGGNARRPATTDNKSGRVRGGSATSPRRGQKKGGGEPNTDSVKVNQCNEFLKLLKEQTFANVEQNYDLSLKRAAFTTIVKKGGKGFFSSSKDQVIGYVLIDGSILSKDPSLVGIRNTNSERCL